MSPESSPLQSVRAFLLRHVRRHNLADDEDIFARGYVTSLFALQLVMFVEKQFAIKVEGDDLQLDNFCTVAAIGRLIDRKRAGAPR